MNMDYAAAIQELKSNADLDNSNEQANIQELENTLKSQSRHSLKSTLSKKNTLTQIPELEEYETKQGKDSAANESRQRNHRDSQIQYPSMTSQHHSQAVQRIDSVSQGSLPSILESEQ
jgi:23S rRNA maturation-related 3'-5' exoribonuclease YhaM